MNANELQNQQNFLNDIRNNNIVNFNCDNRFQLETLKVSTIKLLLDLGNVNADIPFLEKSLHLLLECIDNINAPAGGSKLKNSNKKNNKTKKNIDKYR